MKATTLRYDLSSGTVLQEMMFQASHESLLKNLKEQIEGKEVNITLEVLKLANKHQLIYQFTHNSNLENTLK